MGGTVSITWYDVAIQAIGLCGVAFFCASYQTKSNKALFVVQTLGCLTFSLQFVLLGAYSGCISLLVNIVRNLMLTRYKEYHIIRWKGWVVIFSLIIMVAAIMTWDGWYSILPVIATVASTIAYWTNSARNIRMATLLANSPSMVLYDILIRSWGGVLNECIAIVSILVSIARFGWSALDGDTIGR